MFPAAVLAAGQNRQIATTYSAKPAIVFSVLIQ
jgi:hypothetical protein